MNSKVVVPAEKLRLTESFFDGFVGMKYFAEWNALLICVPIAGLIRCFVLDEKQEPFDFITYKDIQAHTAWYFDPTGISINKQKSEVYFSCASACNIYRAKLNDKPSKHSSFSLMAGSARRFSAYADGIGEDALFDSPHGLVFTEKKKPGLFVCDSGNCRIRHVDVNFGLVTTFVGAGLGVKDGCGTEARFTRPLDICVSWNEDRLFVTDSVVHDIRCVDIDTRQVSTISHFTVQASFPISTLVCDGSNMLIASKKSFGFQFCSTSVKAKSLGSVMLENDRNVLGICMEKSTGDLFVFENDRILKRNGLGLIPNTSIARKYLKEAKILVRMTKFLLFNSNEKEKETIENGTTTLSSKRRKLNHISSKQRATMICVLSVFLDSDYWIEKSGLAQLIELGASKKILIETESKLLFSKILMKHKRAIW